MGTVELVLNDVDISSHEFEMMMAGTSVDGVEAEGWTECEEVSEGSGGEDSKRSFDGPTLELSPRAPVLGLTGEASVEASARSPAMCGPRIFRTKWAYRLVMRWSSAPSFSERESNTLTKRCTSSMIRRS